MSSPTAGIDDEELQAYVDGRLDAKRAVAVERYLVSSPSLAAQVAEDRWLRDTLRASLAAKGREPVPPRLRIESIRAANRQRWRRLGSGLAAALAIFAIGLGTGWGLARAPRPYDMTGPTQTAALAQDASRAFRTFVTEVAHPVEVPAAQEAHLLRWLSKRLGTPLMAPDLAAYGYRLMGGRLLPGHRGAAAQLMYDDGGGKRLTLYVAAAPGEETAFRFAEDAGASTFTWIDGGFGFAVTAQATRTELLPIAEAVYRSLETSTAQRNG